MDTLKLASGDSEKKSPRFLEEIPQSEDTSKVAKKSQENNLLTGDVTTEIIENNETQLKERIAQCRGIIESLKQELNKEKSKLDKETKCSQPPPVYVPMSHDTTTSDFLTNDLYSSNMYSSYVDNKLNCDENVIEYEKQLQKYQNTLNMAQIEKKNAIRKQMLAKAYKLKLLEVENQCNIELLRVKQSLQCLEPLQMIANKWKQGSANDCVYDLNNFELIPRFPELNASSSSDINSYRDDFDGKSPSDKTRLCAKEDSSSSDC